MHQPDFDDFRGLLDRCGEAFGKGKPPDSLVQTYWRALRDVSWGTVRECGEMHLRFGKFFPKPSELRPKEEKPKAVDAAAEAAFKAAEQRSVRNLEELRAKDEEAWRKEVRLRYLDRQMATLWEGSPIYAQAKREWLQLRGLA